MTDATLRYRDAPVEALREGEACVRPCTRDGAPTGLRLWVHVREDDGHMQLFSVAIHPGGPPLPSTDAAHRAWGFVRVAPGTWAVSPSIDVADTHHWHHTPQVVGVPEPAPWAPPA